MEGDIKLARKALNGDAGALELLVASVRDRIFGLAVRMLYDPDDAEDATQEILVKIVTRLDSFRGESSFHTWCFAVAANHLRDVRRTKAEDLATPLEELDDRIQTRDPGPWDETLSPAMQRLVVEEVRISCLQGLLQSLDRGHRLAYLLAEVFGVAGDQGAKALCVTPQAYRKRLSRAKARIGGWMRSKCSLIDPANPCSCEVQARHHVRAGDLRPENARFAGHPCIKRHDPETAAHLAEMDEMRRVAALFRAEPDMRASRDFAGFLRELVDSGRYRLMSWR